MLFPFISIPILVVIITQIIKLSIDGVKGNLTIKNILSDYSGMPSSHSAFVASILALTFIEKGADSLEFGIAFVFASIVIRDALGFRRHLGTITRKLNSLSKKDPLPPNFGHKPMEVIIGFLLGILIVFLLKLV